MSTPITLMPETEVPAYVTDPNHRWIAVCMGTGCTSSESDKVRDVFARRIGKTRT